MTAPRLGGLSLCASCGRDRQPSAERCPCGAPDEAWQLVGAAPPGSMLETRFASFFFGGLALLVAVAIASANSLVVLGTLLVAPVLALVAFFGGRQWRTESGSRATTFLGAAVVAHGQGVVLVALPVRGCSSLRGDLVAAALMDGRADKPWLGSNLAENAILASLLGAASRGSIGLHAEDRAHWKRTGNSIERGANGLHPDAILVTATAPLGAEEDKLLHHMLVGVRPGAALDGGYRDNPRRNDAAGTPLRTLIAELQGMANAQEFAARYASAESQGAGKTAILEALERASADPTLRSTVRSLLNELRGSQTRVGRALSLLG